MRQSTPTRSTEPPPARQPAAKRALTRDSERQRGRSPTRSRTRSGLRVEVQYARRPAGVPGPVVLRRWARAAHAAGVAALAARAKKVHATDDAAITVRVVGSEESRRLNGGYRSKDKPTNVLSFPASTEERAMGGALGDLVICAPVVAREAREQGKPLRGHWAHMVVHGTLHLLGYDHEQSHAARRMEGLEVEILRGLGFHDPYRWATHVAV
jgi:probable rRNA maturation factor